MWLNRRVRQSPGGPMLLHNLKGIMAALPFREGRGTPGQLFQSPPPPLPQQPCRSHPILSVSTLTKKWDLVVWVRSQSWEATSSSHTNESRTHDISLGTHRRSLLLSEVFFCHIMTGNYSNNFGRQLSIVQEFGLVQSQQINFLIKLHINRFTW